MSDDQIPGEDDATESPLNKPMSPLAGGALFGGIAFAFILYRSHDLLRAILVGAAVFAMLFWVMWAGQYLQRRSKKQDD